MPELPEVEAVCRKLRAAAVDSRITGVTVYRPHMTYPQAAALVRRRAQGRKILAVRRRGKHILLDLEGGFTAHVHLRMTGDLLVVRDAGLRPETARIWFALEDGRALILDDPRALGRVTVRHSAEVDDLLRAIGPELFDAVFTPTPAYLAAAAARTPKAAKIFLMDQRAVAGLGNIYASEALFEARIHPATPACDLSTRKVNRLHGAIVEVLTTALHSAISAYGAPGGFAEGESFPAAVYGGGKSAVPDLPHKHPAHPSRGPVYLLLPAVPALI